MLTILCLSVIISLANCQELRSGGPTNPYDGFTADDCVKENYLVVDANNMCWYHQCVIAMDEKIVLLPRRCALGSKISYNFVHGESNPCTVNFDTDIGYDCTRERESVDGPPSCFTDPVVECLNGGQLTYQSDRCWCFCDKSWRGDSDCSKPTIPFGERDLRSGSDICVGGAPERDFCEEVGGCLNGGNCNNQCDTFWCDCPEHNTYDYWGKRCEIRELKRK